METKEVVKMKLKGRIVKEVWKKRAKELDSDKFPIDKLKLNPYDIRKTRNTENMIKVIKSAGGQLKPIIVNQRNNGDNIIVDGRTRYEAMRQLDYKTIKVIFFRNLTELEEDLYNAISNNQTQPLRPDEKRAFVLKHSDKLNNEELCEILNIDKGWLKKYKNTCEKQVTEKVLEQFKQVKAGYGRGTLYIEAISDVASRCKSSEALEEIGKWHKKQKQKGVNDRDLRYRRKRIAEKTEKAIQNKSIRERFTSEKELTRKIIELETTKEKYGSGDKLPKNSEGKYIILDKILKDGSFDFALILFSEGLQRKKGKLYLDSETKRIIDNGIKQIIVNSLDLDKITEIEEYAKTKNREITT